MRTNRPYVQIDPDVLERIRQIDLLSYLREFEPSNLVKVKGTSNVYCTAEHDSLKISNGKWYWWSRGFGGYSALDYLIKVKEYDFVEAVEILTGQTMADWKPPPAPKKDEPKVLLLPPKNKDCNRVIQYLFGRGIDYQLIQECISDGTLYESADYHNAVFIGKDESGTPKYAALRSTLGSTFKQDASGSDKRYSFRLLAREPTDTVHLFEAAIDLLSYATYEGIISEELWQKVHAKRMATGIAILVTEIFENTVEHYKLDNTTWATVIFVVLAAMTALFAVIWLYASCQKVDKEDEMAKENMLKAHQSITKMFLIILAVAIFISMFWEGSITIKINSDRLYQVWFIFWFSYMTLESGFFLHHEGKLSTDEEDE
ncbi:DUF3991 domain-containing protein [Ruminococcus sp.]|uniref:DUF3991 domain-containing protein n=3 Tax=Ruminococcus TaxID=1263 RepID=UPI003AF92CD5